MQHRNHMTGVIKQTKQMMMDQCHLKMDRQQYAVAANRIGNESDV